ncbi:flagellar basal body P-ring formation chaperone FlgA [Pseudomonas sp. ZM23]|uniref:Flagella basal body P-ring formation protein FlgA n=1 Tax=Pseudomonas triclosanedens TaxID=2961893 RepID=A0ABY6ZY69_9PSED|nr:flagellar basal body P-ring formation chaperone FlgA [Pseudomonas triclosanedens]MCP8462720.1 flagellar basal body P-ring formation chaperone FlgA [Pseudomonas triclosanedens]MCP8468339.1 flagellar basal body P-ring formation chaperone FlgA [Pseudomonas triclosanedens]MCP8475098.1 flagellar basal body P-ring formation chaperone FlgA [Pseudomonas triclosanedens]WAI49907.1 flagellar basal body P-ring formation chaperone FlgA [Pseudomonas triclosanedens]
MSLINKAFRGAYDSVRNAAFPLSAQPGTGSGKAFSACFLLLLAPLAWGQDARQQLDAAAQRQVASELKNEARAQGWKGMTFTVDNNLPNSLGKLPACPREPQLRVSEAPSSATARRRFEADCPGQSGWPVYFTSQSTVMLPAVFASSAIERGQTLDANQLKLAPLDIGKTPRGYFTDIAEVAGKTARRRIRADQPLSPALLDGATLVRRGQQVKIVASQDGIQASAVGEAMANGKQDDVIRVKNLRSQKIIDAKVVESGVVSSIF